MEMQLLYVEFEEHLAYQLKLIIYCDKSIALMLTILLTRHEGNELSSFYILASKDFAFACMHLILLFS